MDEASFGDGGTGAVSGELHKGGDGGLYHSMVVGKCEVVHGDATGVGGHPHVLKGVHAAADHEIDLVRVSKRVVALVPPLLHNIGRGEAVSRQGLDADAPIVLLGVGAKIPGQLALHQGAVFALLAHEHIGGLPIGDCCRAVRFNAGGHGRT